MEIQSGEIYGKQTAGKFVMYNVLKVGKNVVILQNIDNPLSTFETTPQKLASSGYVLISQTPYINTGVSPSKKRRIARKPQRCPYTLDFIEQRADNERPAPQFEGLFT